MLKCLFSRILIDGAKLNGNVFNIERNLMNVKLTLSETFCFDVQ